MIPFTVISFIELPALIIVLCTDIFILYFMISSLVAYVELKENSLYIKFGFILKREIPYNTILEINKEKKGYYVVIEASVSSSKVVDEFARRAKLNANVLRHLVIAK